MAVVGGGMDGHRRARTKIWSAVGIGLGLGVLLLLALLAGGCASKGDFGLIELPGLREAVAAPVTPTLSVSTTTGMSWYVADDGLAYTTVAFEIGHADPADVDYYEVWRSKTQPYFEPASCGVACTMITTTGMLVVMELPEMDFNPISGTAGADIGGGTVAWAVRAVNGAGTSGLSNRVGVSTWSLRQGMREEDLVLP